MMASSVRVESVTKRFAGHTAVDRLSMEVASGGIFGLLGPNGAGKTTMIRLIMGILAPDSGSISLFGSGDDSRKLSARIGYLPEERGLYKKMKVLDHLIFLGETKGISRRDARVRALGWLQRLGVADWAQKKVEDLSKGMQQKVQFAGALLHEPELVILDEPFSGLDPVNAQVMKDIVVELAASGRTVLFSTHVMEQAEAILADRALVASIDDYGASAELQLAEGADPQALLAALVHAGVALRHFELVEPSLQSIFIARVGASAAVAPAKVAA
jgi:ABC-2 type transport system ATP-binding protein